MYFSVTQRNQRRDVRPEPGSHGTLNERSQRPAPLQGPCGKGAQPPAPWAGSSQQLGDDQGQGALSPQEPDQPPSDQGVVASQLQSRGPIGDSSPGLAAHRGQGGGPRPGALCPDAAFSVGSAGAKPEDGRQRARSGHSGTRVGVGCCTSWCPPGGGAAFHRPRCPQVLTAALHLPVTDPVAG